MEATKEAQHTHKACYHGYCFDRGRYLHRGHMYCMGHYVQIKLRVTRLSV